MAEKEAYAGMRAPELRVDWNKIGLNQHRRQLMAECIAEFVGTAFLILVGDSTSAMTLLFNDPNPFISAYAGTAFGWGFAVTFAILCVGSVSGAHINSAVTLSLALFRGFSWWKVPFYITAQVLGAMVGSMAMYSQYVYTFDNYYQTEGTTIATDATASKVFFTQPQTYIPNWFEFTNQMWQTGILMMGIFAMTDPYNPGAYMHSGLRALMIGFLVAMIGMAYGFLEGWAINPARDLGPRVMGWAIGMDALAFPGINNTWWVPIFGCFLGGILGAGLYELFLRPWMPGVRVHGDTPSTKAWAWCVLKLFPSLRADSSEEYDPDHYIDGKGIRRRGKRSDVWDEEVGPGGNVKALTGIRGFDEDLPYTRTDIGRPSPVSTYMKQPSNPTLDTDLETGYDGSNSNSNLVYPPDSILPTTQNTPTGTPGTTNHNNLNQNYNTSAV